MKILQYPAVNWNTFPYYVESNQSSLDNDQINKWQNHPMPGWSKKRYSGAEITDVILDFSSKHFKYSKFNVEYSDADSSIIFNTASEALVLLTTSEMDEIITFRQKGNKSKHFLNATLPILYNLGIIISDEDNENFKINFIRNRSAHEIDGLRSFIIYPTHQCNARCFYCFAHNDIVSNKKMSFEKADEVLSFIYKNVQINDNVVFRWFGGEPLMAADIISYIISEFVSHFGNNVNYHSIITTNGSLLSEEIISEAKILWNLRKIHISIDGFKEEHDKRKNYYDKSANRYEQVKMNIRNLLDHGIYVVCRLNIDKNNMLSIEPLLDDLSEFANHQHFYLHATTLHIPENSVNNQNYILDMEYPQFYDKVIRLMLSNGFYTNVLDVLPKRLTTICTANLASSILINADGDLFKCEQETHDLENSVGNCIEGVIHNSNLIKWMNTDLAIECNDCAFLPICQGGCKYYRNRSDGNVNHCNRFKYYYQVLLKIIKEQQDER